MGTNEIMGQIPLLIVHSSFIIMFFFTFGEEWLRAQSTKPRCDCLKWNVWWLWRSKYNDMKIQKTHHHFRKHNNVSENTTFQISEREGQHFFFVIVHLESSNWRPRSDSLYGKYYQALKKPVVCTIYGNPNHNHPNSDKITLYDCMPLPHDISLKQYNKAQHKQCKHINY